MRMTPTVGILCVAIFGFVVGGCGGSAYTQFEPGGRTSPTRGSATPPSAKPGTPATLVAEGGPLAGNVATSLSIAVTVKDSPGKPVPNQVIDFVMTSGGGRVFAPAVLSSAAGVANEVWTLGTRAGTQTVEARWIDPATGAPHVLGTIIARAQAGPATRVLFGFENTPVSIRVGTPVTVGSMLTLFGGVGAVDQYGNVVSATDLAYSTTGNISLSGSTLNSSTPGIGHFVATLGTLSDSSPVFVNDELSKRWWSLTFACSGSAGGFNGDSLVVALSGALTYATPSIYRAAIQVAHVPVTGTATV